MKKTLLVFALIAVVATMGFASGQEETASFDGVEFVVGNGSEPESLDPHLISGVPEHRIMMAIFEGLVESDPVTARARPGIAESWDVNEAGTVYTFYLREGVHWSDGTPITAQTVYDSWARALAPETASPYAWFPALFLKGANEYNSGEGSLADVAMEVVDDSTFRFETVGPMPYTVDALTHYSFTVVPMHAIEEYGSEWVLPENFVGNGPFVLTEWSPQERVVVEPNPEYWNAENIKLDRVVFLPVESDTTMYNMFINGEMDWATDVPLGKLDEAELRDDYHVAPQLSTYYYVFNTQEEPVNDVRVRKALSMAVDRQALVDTVTRAGQMPAYGVVPTLSDYEALDTWGEDLVEARALLAEAGYPDGVGFPTMTILYNTDEAHKAIAEFVQQQWKDNLGVDVVLENQEWGTYLANRRNHQFQVARAGWIGDYQDANTFLDMFVTGGALNGGQFSNETYDNLIAQAARMAGGPERTAVLQQAERIFIEEEMAIMPLYYYVDQHMIDLAKWGGWHQNIMGFNPVGDVYQK